MNIQRYMLAISLFLCAIVVSAQEVFIHIHQHVDPLSTAAIKSQTRTLERLYNDRIDRQSLILAEETVINATLGSIHNLQKKTFEYLSHAQSAIQTLSQLKTIKDLVIDGIPQNVSGLLSEIKTHPQRAALAGITSNLLTDLITEAGEVAALVETLVTSSTVKKDKDGNIDTKGKVNLLNGSERLQVAETIISRLRSLNNSLVTIRWQINAARYPKLHLAGSVIIPPTPKEGYKKWDEVAATFFGSK